jgi:hypothetical protein
VVFVSTVPPRAGGEVDAFCSRCKLKLAHTILAMVGARVARVRCNTCQSEHAYRATAKAAAKKRAESSKHLSKPEARLLNLDELLKGKDSGHPHRYSTGEVFARGEVVEHPTFGTGVVLGIRGDRFDSLFRAGVKTLAQRKAHAALTAHHERAAAPPDALDEPGEGHRLAEDRSA